MAEQVCYCGEPIPPDGLTDLYCSAACQARWQAEGFDPIPIPARPEWRMGLEPNPEGDWRRQMAWPDVPALPPTDAELRQRIEDTDPAPVDEPLPPVPESCYPPGAVNLPIQYAKAGALRRIFNATRRNT